MSTLLTGLERMPSEERERIDLRAESSLVVRIRAMAEKLGMGKSAYIRQAVILKLQQDEAAFPDPKKRKT
jgi:hypothetical protein